MKYKVGMKLKCVKQRFSAYTVGKIYEIKEHRRNKRLFIPRDGSTTEGYYLDAITTNFRLITQHNYIAYNYKNKRIK